MNVIKPIDPIFAPIPYGDDRQAGRTRRGLHSYLEYFLDPDMVYCHCLRNECQYRWKIPKKIYMGFGTGGLGTQNAEHFWPTGATGSSDKQYALTEGHDYPCRNIGTGGTGQSGLANNYKAYTNPETGIVTGSIGGTGHAAYGQFTTVGEDCHTGGIAYILNEENKESYAAKYGYEYEDWLEYTFFYCTDREELAITDETLEFIYAEQKDSENSIYYPIQTISTKIDSTSWSIYYKGWWTPPKDYYTEYTEFHDIFVGTKDEILEQYDSEAVPSFCSPIFTDSTTYLCEYIEIQDETIIENPNTGIIYMSSECAYDYNNNMYVIEAGDSGCINGINPCDKIEYPLTCDYRGTDDEYNVINYSSNTIRGILELDANQMEWLSEYVGYSGGPGDINTPLPSPRAWGCYPMACPNCQKVSFECYWIEREDNLSLGPTHETIAQQFMRNPNTSFDFTAWEFCKSVIVRDVQLRINDADFDYD